MSENSTAPRLTPLTVGIGDIVSVRSCGQAPAQIGTVTFLNDCSMAVDGTEGQWGYGHDDIKQVFKDGAWHPFKSCGAYVLHGGDAS